MLVVTHHSAGDRDCAPSLCLRYWGGKRSRRLMDDYLVAMTVEWSGVEERENPVDPVDC